ncbi:hypothetical protein M0805_005363 [Coniferiporia weirii]|nr:hypothetical protein M0805_005363 [Coniferiporia weirii]
MAGDSSETDRDALLAMLQAHGQNFWSSSGPPVQASPLGPKGKRRKLELGAESRPTESSQGVYESDTGDDDDEWCGFGSSTDAPFNESDSADDSSNGVEEDKDDEFRSDQPPTKQPEVVVFSAMSNPVHPRISKLQAKSFMSSKVSKLREDMIIEGSEKAPGDDENCVEERTNLQNDALLYKLVHTQLLSGSLNPDLGLTPAQRRKALEGRVLELAAGAKLGKGESVVRQEERQKASKRVRMGLQRKVEEKKSMTLEKAKDLGNYHHSIKHLFEASSDGQPDRRKRERGLKLGVGRFSRGILKLSKDDVAPLQRNRDAGRGGRPTQKRKR